MPDNNHYLPQFILARFKDRNLWELDKSTGRCEPRAIDKAGRFLDFYPKHIEDSIMTKWDTAAAAVCRRRIFGKSDIRLSGEERLSISTWLALFFVRGPYNFEQISGYAAAIDTDEIVKYLYRNPFVVLTDFRERNYHHYQLAMRLFGRRNALQYLLMRAELQVRRDPLAFVNPQKVFHTHIESKPHEQLGSFLAELNWSWLTTDGDFIIADTAIARWHVATSTPHYGINRAGVELTIPFSKTLTLRMSVNGVENTLVEQCGEETMASLNARQLASAVRMVYAPSPRLLKPHECGFEL